MEATSTETATTNGAGDPAAVEPATEKPKTTRRSRGGKPKTKPAASDPTFAASYTGTIPDDLGKALNDLSGALKMPVWLLINGGLRSMLDVNAMMAFLGQRARLEEDGHIALVIDSPGGLAESAYKIARLLQRNDGFTAVVPRYAKSAATLLMLGAQDVVMGADAEIGPLDAQLYDEERERRTSALDTVMSLSTLQTAALEHLDEAMLVMRMGMRSKRSDVLLPHAIQLVSNTMIPLLEKIDTVDLARQSRQLKIAEEYAKRLMTPTRGNRTAKDVAEALVNDYPDHSFVIDRSEACAKELVCPVDHDEVTAEALGRVELALWTNDCEVLGRLEVQS